MLNGAAGRHTIPKWKGAHDPGSASRPVMGLLSSLSVMTLVLGYASLNGYPGLSLPSYALAVFILILAMYSAYRYSLDWLNPLTILIGTVLVRVGAPAVALLLVEPPVGFPWLPLTMREWEKGVGLSMLGIVGVVVGWTFCGAPIRQIARKTVRFLAAKWWIDERIVTVSVLGMLAGLILLGIYVRVNGLEIVTAITRGSLRTLNSQAQGASRYAIMGIPIFFVSAALLSGFLLYIRRSHWLIGLGPVIFATVIMTPLGGRMQALAPLVYGLTLLWYRQDRRQVTVSRFLSSLLVLGLIVAVYAVFVWGYRGAGISSGVSALDASRAQGYLEFSFWYESGALHPYAAAALFEAGVLDGATLPLVGGIASELLEIQGVRPGSFIVSTLTDGFYSGAREWGIHSGLFVDMYLNEGLGTAIVSCLLLGLLLRAGYEGMRAGRTSPPVLILHASFAWSCILLYYEGIVGALNVIWTVIPTIAAAILLSRLIPSTRLARVKARAS